MNARWVTREFTEGPLLFGIAALGSAAARAPNVHVRRYTDLHLQNISKLLQHEDTAIRDFKVRANGKLSDWKEWESATLAD